MNDFVPDPEAQDDREPTSYDDPLIAEPPHP
jgi:hypothetical protein